MSGTGKHKTGVSLDTLVYEKYGDVLSNARNELFAQFFIRIYSELEGCRLACFSKLKYVNGSNFIKFRETFRAKFLGGFMTPSHTFDNVKGSFPIGFLIWDTSKKEAIQEVELDTFNESGNFSGRKKFYNENLPYIVKWITNYKGKNPDLILAMMNTGRTDFQHQNLVYIMHDTKDKGHSILITSNNLIPTAIYFSVRHAIPATWINDRDQFYYPNSQWEEDREFQSDCLAFMLFHGQNRISAKEGTNHFIPFTEKEVGAKGAFESNFMHRFIEGRVELDSTSHSLFGSELKSEKLEFSPEAKAVLKAGRELFAYYHAQDFSTQPYIVSASLYDIKEFFQGRNEKGRMNPPSRAKDSHYKDLISDLNIALNALAKKLEPRIYEYGFLKE